MKNENAANVFKALCVPTLSLVVLVSLFVLSGTPPVAQAQINRNMALDVINIGFQTGLNGLANGGLDATTIISVTQDVSGIVKGASTIDFAFAQVVSTATADVFITHTVISATGELEIHFATAAGTVDVSVALQVWR